MRDLLVSVAPDPVRLAALEVDRTELAMMERETEQDQLDYAQALADWGDVGGYEWETLWDVCTVAALGTPFDRAQWRKVSTLSGGEQKRVVLEALLRGPDEVLVLDEPDNYLDVPTKRWLEARLVESPKTVLFVSHDRELLDRVATRIATLEPSSGGNTVWVHPGRFSTYEQARVDRNDRLDELRRRWDEEHVKLKELVVMYRREGDLQRRDGVAPAGGRDPAAPLRGGRAARRPCRCARRSRCGSPGAAPPSARWWRRPWSSRSTAEQLMRPFDTEIWFGERVGVLGSNGSGKSHFLRLLAAGGSDPDREHEPVGDIRPTPVEHEGRVVLGSRVRPGWFAQTHDHASLHGRTLLEILHRGDDHRAGMPRDLAARTLDRYGLAKASEQTFDSLSGGQQARLQILLLELSGATLLLLDEPTDNLDLHSAEALEDALDGLRGHRARGDPRPLVRPRFRPLPRVPRRRQGGAERRAGVGRGPGQPAALRRRRRPDDRATALVEPGGRDDTGGMDPQRNKAVILDAVAALNRGDVEGYLAIYAPGAVVHGLPEHATPDPAGHRDVLTDIRRALPDFRAEVDDVVAEGDLLAARVTYTGTHEGR